MQCRFRRFQYRPVSGVDNEQDTVGVPDDGSDPRFGELLRDRRDVHYLDLNVLVFHHAGEGSLRGEWVIPNVRLSVGKPRKEP